MLATLRHLGALLAAAVLISLAIGVSVPSLAGGQPAAQPPIVGAWHLFIQVDGNPDTIQHLATFSADGTYLQSSLPDESTGHGVWQQTGQNAYGLTFESLAFDPDAPGPVTLKVWSSITVDASGNLNAPFRFAVLLPDGTVLDQGAGTATGRRIVVEPF